MAETVQSLEELSTLKPTPARLGQTVAEHLHGMSTMTTSGIPVSPELLFGAQSDATGLATQTACELVDEVNPNLVSQVTVHFGPEPQPMKEHLGVGLN